VFLKISLENYKNGGYQVSLEEYKHDMLRCTRCSYCKWIPWEDFKNTDFTLGCPSLGRYNWHAYSAGGRFNIALSLLEGRINYSETLLDVVYQCQMDGSCDVSCKSVQDIEPLQMMQELRIKCVQDGQIIPAHAEAIDSLNKDDNMMKKPRADRGNWAADLNVKNLTREKAKVLYHAGCRYSYDESLWPVVRSGLTLLQDAGIDIGILGTAEICCGGRAYELGYEGELENSVSRYQKIVNTMGVETIVTPCAHCYQTMKVLYEKIGKNLGIEVMHITEYLEKLVNEGRIKLRKKVPLKITYHDPCHLGRLAEPWVHWNGVEKKVLGQMIVHDPPKKFRRGANGVYDTPRNILNRIPGLQLTEMYRNRAWGWCCGAGGGVREAYPDFAVWTAKERIREAMSTGAEALVSACPSCKQIFTDAVKETGDKIRILDVIELVQESV
jgi:Fe-S oxidoreductase